MSLLGFAGCTVDPITHPFAKYAKRMGHPLLLVPAEGRATRRDQLKVLTQKLDLSVDQQPKVKTILQELHDASLKLMQGQSASHEELLSKVRPLRMNADKKIREILGDDQKKKLDQYLQGSHAEMHGNLSGATPPATGKPKP